ncbi:MAG: PadR family transcriptional regulator [Clostridia bacterium]|nr:PadR family transcriptional regulator [Clostridia bacterium]
MPISSDEIRGHTETIILARLMEGDSYGYEIGKTVRELSGGLYELKEATLYSAFRRMETDWLIESYWGESEGGARRRYYRITEKGRQAYRAGLESWRETKTIIDGLLERGAVSNEEKA